ncbi:MAG: CCA tRNA nucleotidyltransferase [Candidatus Eiseniibacteriota bacterium]
MTAPETRAVIAALTARGAEVRFVGGCVRDAAIGRAVTDIDIATHDLPETVIDLLKAAHLKVVPTGLKHGTVTAVVKGHHFEITTLRRDVETFGRHARVEFTDDWAADAARRDFTMNAMFLGADGRLYDPFGGLADLEAGRVRFVGDARLRIKEDVLRLLRFFRFHARYGKGAPDADGLAACRELAPLLPTLSAERVRDETLKLLRASAPADILRLMAREKILAHYLPEARQFDRLASLTELAPERAAPDGLRRLAAVLDVDGAGARDVGARLRLSNAEIKRLGAALEHLPGFVLPPDTRALRRALYTLGAELYRDLVLLAWAEARARRAADDAPFARQLDESAAWQRPTLPVKGPDVMALGVKRGPKIGQLLKRVEQWWIEGDFRATREDALAHLRTLAAEKPAKPPRRKKPK